jgi:MATE family multidrug resistance protein
MDNTVVSGTAPRGAWNAEFRATLSLAWPLVFSNLAGTLMTTIDVVFMGRLGPTTLAAGALGTNLYFATFIGAIGIVSAVAPMIARELGRNRFSVRDVRRTFRQGLWVSVILSVPAWILLWQAEAILLLLRQDPELSRLAGQYVRALQWTILPGLLFIVLRSLISAMERPLAGLVISFIGVGVNALAAWVLIFGHFGFPAFGLIGAGIGTTFTHIIMVLALAAFLMVDRRFRRYRFFGRWWRPDWKRQAELWRLGLPIGVTLAFEVTVFNAAAFLMGIISAESLAAYAIAIQIASLTFMVPLGVNQAATVRVGRAFGAGDREGIRLAGWTAYAIGLSFMVMTAALFLLAPEPLVGAFLDLGDPANAAVIGLAVMFLAFAGLFQIVDGGQVVGLGVLRGLHDTRVPMYFAAFGYWVVGLPLGALLAFYFGLEGAGIWIGLSAGLAVVAVLVGIRWYRREELGLTSRTLPADDLAPVGEAAAPGVGPGSPAAQV